MMVIVSSYVGLERVFHGLYTFYSLKNGRSQENKRFLSLRSSGFMGFDKPYKVVKKWFFLF